MSMHACVAQTNGKDSWKGIYSCYGHPSGLGKRIWDKINNYLKDVEDPRKAVKSFCRAYIDDHPKGWISFAEVCYCHNKDGNLENKIDLSDPSWIDYLYVIDPENLTMVIRKPWHKDEDGCWEGDRPYWHEKIEEISLLGREPNWEDLDKV